MKITTIIPLYNKEKSIARAMQSVLNQHLACDCEHELIVIDDGSTDNSLATAAQIKAAHTDREITIYAQKNAGVSAARNQGIQLAKGQFVSFLDADDTYDAEFLNEICSLIANFPDAALFATRYRFIDAISASSRDAQFANTSEKRQQYLANYFDSATRGDLPVTSSSVCLDRATLLEIGGFPVNENMGEDQAVWSQFALQHPIAISQEVLANYYTLSDNSLMSAVKPCAEMPFSIRLQEALDQQRIPTHLIISVRAYIAGHLLDLVRRNIANQQFNSARRLLNDPRTKNLGLRKTYWSMRLTLALITHNLLSRQQRG
ncbi:glycosyltransferase family 2 protein [Arenicella xantha]|uniref:Glycosyl transferase family 2 n=1 Tax=Arenicella xantha TaxID=644221 RepID=A0A395JL37_9GAMM|nr:glycosyltransferase family 2 protein [Arenicella xantha]RBP51421.1 glycosyl transferase family 2 [Arenicella xantha]